jgi:hypothetical protein
MSPDGRHKKLTKRKEEKRIYLQRGKEEKSKRGKERLSFIVVYLTVVPVETGTQPFNIHEFN